MCFGTSGTRGGAPSLEELPNRKTVAARDRVGDRNRRRGGHRLPCADRPKAPRTGQFHPRGARRDRSCAGRRRLSRAEILAFPFRSTMTAVASAEAQAHSVTLCFGFPARRLSGTIFPRADSHGANRFAGARKAIRLIEDILVVSQQVRRASFPVRPDCDLEAPGILVARLGDVKDHRARPLALRWALHQRKNASPRHIQLLQLRPVGKVFDSVDVSKTLTERFVVAEN